MPRHFRLLRLAELELDAAVIWYESERPGLGFEFFEHYEAAVQQALRFPNSGSPVADRRLTRDVRRVVFERFPYDLITTRVDAEIVVVAIAHHKRRPGYWRKRLAKAKP